MTTNPSDTFLHAGLNGFLSNDLGLRDRQLEIRRLARKASSVHVLWGQRAGKTHLAPIICLDFLGLDPWKTHQIAVVGAATQVNACFFTPLKLHVAPLSLSDLPACFHTYSVRKFLEDDTSIRFDAVFIDEIDWLTPEADRLIKKAESLSRFVFTCSSPSQRNSSYVQLVTALKKKPVRGVVVDHSTTFEANPELSRDDFAADERIDPERFARDFLAYKDC